ncbi:Uncharacterized protein YhaN [Amphibacillus marinus]|uniref:Uncharacterized protein YhaN n=1 Tax=Amphibacillus marinus TaxID=872970 RepID=A0A1H8IK44_9BACI|nr:YhaN family protein [Amphibacillus marinus]SEN68556.1 Uncharacterized protein YhaN [Amphibacillus marinus]
MRFESINLEAYGHFTDFSLDFNQHHGFHILYGPNEAGKSTILRSITNLLYGFPQQTQDAFQYTNQQLRVGGVLRNSRNESLAFVRRKGLKNTVLNLESQPIDDHFIHNFLAGLSKAQFLNMFALDHERLREGGESLLLSEDNANENLFSAASGISTLRQVLTGLDDQMRELYLKGGSKPEINHALKEEKEINQLIKNNQLNQRDWIAIEQTYLNAQTQLSQLKDALKSLKIKELKFKRLEQTLPKVAERQKLIAKLSGMEAVPLLPIDTPRQRVEYTKLKQEAVNQLDNCEIELKQIEAEIMRIDIPEAIIKHTVLIEELNRELKTYQGQKKEYPILINKLTDIEQHLYTLLKALDPTQKTLTAIENYRIPVEDERMIRSLSHTFPQVNQALEQANKQVKILDAELKKQENVLAQLGAVADFSALERNLKQAREEGKLEQLISQAKLDLEQLEGEIANKIGQLSLWSGTEEQLSKLNIPNLPTTIKKYEERILALQQRQHNNKLAIESVEQDIAMRTTRIREIEAAVSIPTEQELFSLRQYRDQSWLLIKKQLNHQVVSDAELQQFSHAESLETIFEASMNKADQSADTMRQEAERLGERNKLTIDIQAGTDKLAQLKQKDQQYTNELQACEHDWKTEWAEAEIEPLTPTEMFDWLKRYDKIVELTFEKHNKIKKLHHLEQLNETLQTMLKQELSRFIEVPNATSLSHLMDEADRIIKDLLAKVSDRKHVFSRINSINEEQDQALFEQQAAKKKLEEWYENWSVSLTKANLDQSVSPLIITELLEHYRHCVNKYDEMRQTRVQATELKKQLTNFKKRAEPLITIANVHGELSGADLMVDYCYQKLNSAKKDQEQLAVLKKQREMIIYNEESTNQTIDKAEQGLNQLMTQAGCSTIEELEAIELKSRQKMQLHEELVLIEKQLVEWGNGLSLDEILAEAGRTTYEEAHSELTTIDFEINRLDNERSTLEQNYGAIKRDYNDKVTGTNVEALKATEEKQALLAKIEQLTDQYIRYRLAVVLLKRGIEHYREQNQNPIISRASMLFQRLTLGSFNSITIDFDEKDQPILQGVRDNGGRVMLSGMSDGTLDQLYLALRIASIEKYVNENEPIPFIVDDILVHFDDQRSKETLKILFELSKQTQVIFFTHHTRMLALMGDSVDQQAYQEIELRQPLYSLKREDK